MKRYTFDLGNSNGPPHGGAIGLCACVHAKSPEQALEILRERLMLLAHDGELAHELNGDDAEYITVYINGNAISTADIDDVEDIMGERGPIA